MFWRRYFWRLWYRIGLALYCGALALAQTSPSTPAAPPPVDGTPTEFQSHGLEYEALTADGVTVMFAPLPPHIKSYNVLQVAVTNGSLLSCSVKPSDFTFVRHDGTMLAPKTADEVVESLLDKASRNDVVGLQRIYEDSIYSLVGYHASNGYQQRKEAGWTQFTNKNFRAAAAASAITLIPAKLKPGDSTDGAVFFENHTKTKVLGAGRLLARTCGGSFAFEVFGEIGGH